MHALNHLPPDLIEAILSFLPPNSLGRFKSVSKSWYSLISSTQFLKIHIRNYTKNNPNPNPTHLILHHIHSYSIYSVNIKQLNTQPTPATLIAKRLNFHQPLTQILGSCNGLILGNDKHHNLYVVNPTTQKSLKIPGGKRDDEIYIFGYDSSIDDYKIISTSYLYNFDPNHTKIVRVYSFRNNSWNMLPNYSYEYGYYGRGVLLNNNLHWVVKSKRSTMTIAAFSLAHEEFHEIEFPDSANVRINRLFAFGEKLAAVIWDELYVYKLWVMEEYGVRNSWTKLCINRDNIDLDCDCIVQVSNRDILLGSKWLNEIVIYNMDERRCKSVTVEGGPYEFMVNGTYVETLESPQRFR